MKIRIILNRKYRFLRVGFTHYVVEKYGVNLNTAHTRFRRGIMSRWMITGIQGCIREYLKDDTYTDFPNFYRNLPVKAGFIRFMSEKMGMGERTARTRFRNFDFTELELRGLESVYEEFIKSLGEMEE